MSISEYEKGKVKCPKCGKGRVKQQITEFMVQTSKKSWAGLVHTTFAFIKLQLQRFDLTLEGKEIRLTQIAIRYKAN